MDLILRPGLSSVAAIGATPNANGASVAGTVLTLQPASASFGGLITAGTQTIAGAKTFLSLILSQPAGTAGISLDPNAATGAFALALSPANLTAARRWSFPDRSDTVAGLGAQTFVGAQTVNGVITATSSISGNTLYSTDNSTSQFRLIPGGSIGVMDVRNAANSAYLPLYLRGLSVNFDQGAVSITDATVSTGTTTGALVVTGGVGIGGRLNVGGAATFSLGSLVSGGSAPSSATMGTTQWVSGTIVLTSFVSSTGAANEKIWDFRTSPTQFSIEAALDNYASSNPAITIARSASSPTVVTIAPSTASTSTTTGALVVTGGVGCGGRVTVDGATTKTLKYANGVANAAVAVLFGAIGPTGSTAGNAQGWIRIDVAGTDRYIPYW